MDQPVITAAGPAPAAAIAVLDGHALTRLICHAGELSHAIASLNALRGCNPEDAIIESRYLAMERANAAFCLELERVTGLPVAQIAALIDCQPLPQVFREGVVNLDADAMEEDPDPRWTPAPDLGQHHWLDLRLLGWGVAAISLIGWAITLAGALS